MQSSDRFKKALDFSEKKHRGQFRIGGLPYITHPVEVANILRKNGYDEEYQIAGLFHDLLEDTDATEQEIREIGGKDVLDAVKLVTKKQGYIMSDYISGIKENPMAFAVKAADRLHNLRSAVVADDDFKRRYILESIDWYLDFSTEIRAAVKQLAESMDDEIYNLSLEYNPITPEEQIVDKSNKE